MEGINLDNLLDYYSNLPKGTDPYIQQIKINDQSVIQDKNGRYKITYEFSTISKYPEDYKDIDLAGKTDSSLESVVILLYPNGDRYEFILNSEPDAYDHDLLSFYNSVNTFYVGKTEKLSDVMSAYNSNANTESATQKIDQVPNSQNTPDPEPEPEPATEQSQCGQGTHLQNGICVLDQVNSSKSSGCLKIGRAHV